jgi:hypothetical protein
MIVNWEGQLRLERVPRIVLGLREEKTVKRRKEKAETVQ